MNNLNIFHYFVTGWLFSVYILFKKRNAKPHSKKEMQILVTLGR